MGIIRDEGIDPSLVAEKRRPLRDAAGRWLPGQRGEGNGGRPPRAVEDMTFQALVQRFEGDSLQKMLDKLQKLAEGGDLHAIRLVLAYLIGQPIERVRNEAGAELVELLRQWRRGEPAPALAPRQNGEGEEST